MSLVGLQIRDAAFGLLSLMPGLGSKTTAGVDSLQEADLPALSVFLVRDDGQVDGDFAGAPHFLHRAAIAMIVRDGAPSPDAIACKLDAWSEQMQTVILSASKNDASPTTGSNGVGAAFAELFEGIASIAHSQLTSPLTGAQYFGDARLEVVFQYRTTWPPNVPDILTSVQVTIEPNDDAAATVTTDHQLPSATFTFPL